VIAQPPVPIASFAQLPAGWHRFAGSDGGAYALSWRYRARVNGWASVLPRNGIAVQVFFLREATPHFQRLKLVMPRSPATTLDGHPDTPEYRIHGRVDGRDVEVWVDIRRPHPTQQQLRLAQDAVSAVRFK
jgi:hypothetical protein